MATTDYATHETFILHDDLPLPNVPQMVEPQYQELLNKDIPHVSKDGVHVVIIAGESLGASVSIRFALVAPLVGATHLPMVCWG